MKQFLKNFIKMEIRVISYIMLNNWKEKEKLTKLLEYTKNGDLIFLEGKLTPTEETELIEKTMKSINKDFSGIEIAYLDYKTEKNFIEKIKSKIIKILLKDRAGITIIGPSKIVKEMKKDPLKIDILLNKK